MRTSISTRRDIRRSLSLLVASAVGLSIAIAAPASAEPETTALPEIVETVSPEGFQHPGTGVTADQLRNVQQQVSAGVEPWASYYDAMTQTTYASTTYVAQNQGPSDDEPRSDAYDATYMRSRALDDSIGAMTQAIMYTTTGDEVYRANALHVLRTWSSLDPEKYEYFADAHIHTGVPLYYFITAAEIIRSTDPENDSLDGYDLRWTETDQQRSETNMVRPTLETFLFSQNRMWNQHTYGVVGMLAAAIFLDDADLYAERVEWFTVNSTYESEHPTINGGDVNGGLTSLMRKIEADDPLNPYGEDFVELLEMGRDQAHAEGDVTTLSAAARMVNNQGTRLDPVDGTVSDSPDAVSPYAFADNRLLHGADAFVEFMMGGDPPFIDTSGGSGELSQAYRGRLRDLMNDLYYQYTYVEGVDVEKEAPYIAMLHERSEGPLYRFGSGIENFWNPRGSDFTDSEYWLAFPEELAEQDVQVPEPASSAELMPAQYGLAVGSGAEIVAGRHAEDVIRFTPRRGDAVAAVRRTVWGDTSTTSLVGIPVRTHGQATLELSATASSDPFAELALPDTRGRWITVWADLHEAIERGEAVGAYVLFLRVTDARLRVEVASVLADATDAITPPVFADAPSLSFVAVAGEGISRQLTVTDPDSDITLSLHGSPRAAEVDADGTLTWTPPRAGENDLLVVASDGEATTTLPVTITVARDREDAIDTLLAGLADESEYTSESWADLEAAEVAAREGLSSETDTFAQLLEDLRVAVGQVALLNPRLDDGTLDFSGIVTSPQLADTTLMALVDGSNETTWGDRRDEWVDLDFGPKYRVQADRFGLLARHSFPNRSEGTNVYGSNDGVSWTLLTEHPNEGDDDAIEYLEVRDEVQHQRFRYIRLQIDEPGIPTDPAYPGIWTQADIRIDGTRWEATLDEVIETADQADLSEYSRGSVVLFEREIDAVRAAADDPEADEDALVERVLAAWDLLEPPELDTVDIDRSWVSASSRSWDGELDPADNGWAMFDNDPATFTDTTDSPGWVSVVPDDGTQLHVVAVRYMPRDGYVSRADGQQIQASDDGGESWTTIATLTDSTEGWNRIDLDTAVTADAVRVLATHGNTNLAELELVSSTVDTSALQLYLSDAADLAEGDWTAESWQQLVSARQHAEEVLAAGADQSAADEAAEHLAAAISELEPA